MHSLLTIISSLLCPVPPFDRELPGGRLHRVGAVGGVFKMCRLARTYFREDENAMLPDQQRQCPHTPIAPGESERRLERTFLYGQDESPSHIL